MDQLSYNDYETLRATVQTADDTELKRTESLKKSRGRGPMMTLSTSSTVALPAQDKGSKTKNSFPEIEASLPRPSS